MYQWIFFLTDHSDVFIIVYNSRQRFKESTRLESFQESCTNVGNCCVICVSVIVRLQEAVVTKTQNS
jgi:hypothetical protein